MRGGRTVLRINPTTKATVENTASKNSSPLYLTHSLGFENIAGTGSPVSENTLPAIRRVCIRRNTQWTSQGPGHLDLSDRGYPTQPSSRRRRSLAYSLEKANSLSGQR
jgi:hypothetical protein